MLRPEVERPAVFLLDRRVGFDDCRHDHCKKVKDSTLRNLHIHARSSRLPFGSGTGLPLALAVSTHKSIAFLASRRAASCVVPWAMQPGSSGTSATNTSSSRDQ